MSKKNDDPILVMLKVYDKIIFSVSLEDVHTGTERNHFTYTNNGPYSQRKSFSNRESSRNRWEYPSQEIVT